MNSTNHNWFEFFSIEILGIIWLLWLDLTLIWLWNARSHVFWLDLTVWLCCSRDRWLTNQRLWLYWLTGNLWAKNNQRFSAQICGHRLHVRATQIFDSHVWGDLMFVGRFSMCFNSKSIEKVEIIPRFSGNCSRIFFYIHVFFTI